MKGLPTGESKWVESSEVSKATTQVRGQGLSAQGMGGRHGPSAGHPSSQRQAPPPVARPLTSCLQVLGVGAGADAHTHVDYVPLPLAFHLLLS